MNNEKSNDIVSNLLYAEAVFMQENLPESEYLLAVEIIDDAFNEIGSDYWKYSRFLRNMADRPQENGCYDLTNDRIIGASPWIHPWGLADGNCF